MGTRQSIGMDKVFTAERQRPDRRWGAYLKETLQTSLVRRRIILSEILKLDRVPHCNLLKKLEQVKSEIDKDSRVRVVNVTKQRNPNK